MAGLGFRETEEMTWGEVLDFIEARREGQRRKAQELSLIAYQSAGLVARGLAEGKLPEVYEVFPFWTEEEVREIRLQRYREMMERYAAQKVLRV